MSTEIKEEPIKAPDDLFTPSVRVSKPFTKKKKESVLVPLSPEETAAMLASRKRTKKIKQYKGNEDLTEIQNSLRFNFNDFADKVLKTKKATITTQNSTNVLKELVTGAIQRDSFEEAQIIIKALSKLAKLLK